MKHLLITILIGLMALAGKAQNEATASKVGFAINSSISGEIYPIRLVPSITYLKNKSQIELGFGIHPFIRNSIYTSLPTFPISIIHAKLFILQPTTTFS